MSKNDMKIVVCDIT